MAHPVVQSTWVDMRRHAAAGPGYNRRGAAADGHAGAAAPGPGSACAAVCTARRAGRRERRTYAAGAVGRCGQPDGAGGCSHARVAAHAQPEAAACPCLRPACLACLLGAGNNCWAHVLVGIPERHLQEQQHRCRRRSERLSHSPGISAYSTYRRRISCMPQAAIAAYKATELLENT